MPGFVGIITNDSKHKKQFEQIAETINLPGNCRQAHVQAEDLLCSVAYVPNTALKGERYFENSRWIVLFSGDIIDHESVPFNGIIASLEQDNYQYFKTLDGIFAIAVYDKIKKLTYLISDRRSQHPLYYFIDNGCFYFSTAPASFCRLVKPPAFNQNWLWEFLYFNFPIGETSILTGVKKVEPATILIYHANSCAPTATEYAPLFRKKEKLIAGKESLELAAHVFASRVPRYFKGAQQIASSLTGGWDARTVLAFAPEPQAVTTYTYGVPGCGDLWGAQRVAKQAHLKHREILFDDGFVRALPNYLFTTIYYSSAAEKIVRSTLLYVYERITNGGTQFPIITSGIALGTIFRGHGLSPEIVSHDMALLFRGGRDGEREGFWKTVVGASYNAFNEHVSGVLRFLKERFGEFTSSEHILSYIMYCLLPGLFGGEVAIANNFSALRIPGLDNAIIDLVYSIKESILSFSEFTGYPRSGRESHILQAYLLQKFSPHFARIPIGNTRPDMLLRGNIIHFVDHLYRGIIWRMNTNRQKKSLLEDWPRWLTEIYWPLIESLIFSPDSRIHNFIDAHFLAQIKKQRTVYFIGKLTTAEIILRLIENRWRKFW